MKCDSSSLHPMQPWRGNIVPMRRGRFASTMNTDGVQAGSTEEDIRLGMARKEFFLEFQPQFEISGSDYRLCGVEALVRWNHPEVGLLLPGEFLPEVEAFGLHCELGSYVLNSAVKQVRAWLEAEGWSPRVAINMAAQQLDGPTLCNDVLEALAACDIATRYIELEILESEVIRNSERASGELHALSAAGVAVAVDDFGTGFACLQYLLQFPFDTLKICSSFVHGIGQGTGADEICQSIIQLGQAMGKRVIAEGVETVEQLAFLRAHYCALAQGFLLARPMSGAAFADAYLSASVPDGVP